MSITHSTDRLEVAPGADGDAQATGSAAPGARGDHGATTVDLRADRTSAQPSGPEPQEHPRAAPDTSPGAARPTFTITDAAASCSVSRKTITRKLPELAGHGAAKDEDGVWRIPVEALLAVGLHPGRSLPQAVASPRPSAAPAPPPESTVPDTITVPRDRWDDLRIRLARAEAEASERALALADARLALRALTAGPTSDASRGPVGGGTSTSGAGATATDPGTDVPPSTPGSPAEGAASAFVLPATAVEATAAGALTPTAAAESTPAPPLQTPGAGAPSAPAAPATTGERPPPPDASGAAADDQGTAALVAARNEAARSGGYVPAAAAPTRKRRWWHSK